MLADAVNEHGGYGVSVYHEFHDEVESYRTHVWQCEGPCKAKAPFFGVVKRAMNRAPGKGDSWWAKHWEECGGAFVKIAEPDLTKEQVDRLSGLKKAGRQSNKIDGWVSGKKRGRSSDGEGVASSSLSEDASIEGGRGQRKKERVTVACPICEAEVAHDSINEHLDESHTS